MGKVTYLLGAGASANALPTIANFQKELSEIINKLQESANYLFLEQYQFVVKDLRELFNKCEEHKTVDTYAKMLFATSKDKEYRKAKCSIILFFELYRYYYNKVDKRYDAFFASIINKSEPRLPNDINIISWNYDYEFEKAFMKYALNSSDDIHGIYQEMNVIHKNIRSVSSLSNNFGIIKVNGTIGYYNSNKELTLGLNTQNLLYTHPNDFSSIKLILDRHLTYSNPDSEYSPAISFSWEDDEEKRVRDNIEQALRDCVALVVIGYSFPTFNREVDSVIFQHIDEYQQPGIYIQDGNYYTIEKKMRKFKVNWLDIEFQEESDLSEFYIPHELTSR